MYYYAIGVRTVCKSNPTNLIYQSAAAAWFSKLVNSKD